MAMLASANKVPATIHDNLGTFMIELAGGGAGGEGPSRQERTQQAGGNTAKAAFRNGPSAAGAGLGRLRIGAPQGAQDHCRIASRILPSSFRIISPDLSPHVRACRRQSPPVRRSLESKTRCAAHRIESLWPRR